MHDDSLTGDHRGNHLVGGGGDDTTSGVAPVWTSLVGGPGADMLDGGEDEGEKDNLLPRTDTNDDGVIDDQDGAAVAASIDWAVYKHAKEGVTVDLSTNRGTGGEAMGDTLRQYRVGLGFGKSRYLHSQQRRRHNRRRRRQRYRVLRGLGDWASRWT